MYVLTTRRRIFEQQFPPRCTILGAVTEVTVFLLGRDFLCSPAAHFVLGWTCDFRVARFSGFSIGKSRFWRSHRTRRTDGAHHVARETLERHSGMAVATVEAIKAIAAGKLYSSKAIIEGLNLFTASGTFAETLMP